MPVRQASRTLSPLIRPNSRSSSFERSSRIFGSIRRTSTMRSPRRPSRADAAPRSRSRNRCPDCVPGGTRRRVVPPSGVGTSIAGAERRLVHRNRQDHVEIVALAAEAGVRSDVDGNVQITRGSAVQARISLTGHANPVAVADACRNPHLHSLGAGFLSGAGALLARPGPPLTGTATGRNSCVRTPCDPVRSERCRRHRRPGRGSGSCGCGHFRAQVRQCSRRVSVSVRVVPANASSNPSCTL